MPPTSANDYHYEAVGWYLAFSERFMAETQPADITLMLREPQPRYGELMSLVYDQLRHIAQSKMSHERRDHTLTPTVLVHEAFVRMTGGAAISWQDRVHFFNVAALAMRRILVDHARARRRHRLGTGDGQALEKDMPVVGKSPILSDDTILILDEAISRFEKEDDELAAVVRLRYFAGLSIEHTALALGISSATVKRRWAFARVWLIRELRRAGMVASVADQCLEE